MDHPKRLASRGQLHRRLDDDRKSGGVEDDVRACKRVVRGDEEAGRSVSPDLDLVGEVGQCAGLGQPGHIDRVGLLHGHELRADRCYLAGVAGNRRVALVNVGIEKTKSRRRRSPPGDRLSGGQLGVEEGHLGQDNEQGRAGQEGSTPHRGHGEHHPRGQVDERGERIDDSERLEVVPGHDPEHRHDHQRDDDHPTEERQAGWKSKASPLARSGDDKAGGCINEHWGSAVSFVGPGRVLSGAAVSRCRCRSRRRGCNDGVARNRRSAVGDRRAG